jgi:hypothetical protein
MAKKLYTPASFPNSEATV